MGSLSPEEFAYLPVSITDAATSPYPVQSWRSLSDLQSRVREGACGACENCPPGGCPYLYDLSETPHHDA